MDCVIVQHASGDLVTTEPRKATRGTLVAVGEAEDGSEGIFVHTEGFLSGRHSANEFRFMQTEVSRERPVDYSVLAALLGEEKARGGNIVWVIGPALVHARAREDFVWFIENGYAGALLGGNAVAVHDLEAAIFGTTLGMSTTGEGGRRRARAPHARHQCHSPGRVDSSGGGERPGQGRDHARPGHPQGALCPCRLDSR